MSSIHIIVGAVQDHIALEVVFIVGNRGLLLQLIAFIAELEGFAVSVIGDQRVGQLFGLA